MFLKGTVNNLKRYGCEAPHNFASDRKFLFWLTLTDEYELNRIISALSAFEICALNFTFGFSVFIRKMI